MADLRCRPVTVTTQLGKLRVECSSRGVCRLEFGVVAESGNGRDRARPSTTLARQLTQFAAGKSVRFAVPLDLTAGTPFQQAVWRALLKIPRGETRSYAWVAKQVGRPRATRAVGAACGSNPVPLIVPCHRVVASDGSLGGFSGGLPVKKKLLKLEGVTLS